MQYWYEFKTSYIGGPHVCNLYMCFEEKDGSGGEILLLPHAGKNLKWQ